MSAGTVLVTRATGSQGLGVCRHMQQNGIGIHAFVRDATDERAIALLRFGATLFEGSLEDNAAVARAVKGCTGLYLNLMPTPQQTDGGLQEAKSILATAKAAGVKHVVYTSSLSVGKSDRIPGWDPKNRYAQVVLVKQMIEEEVKAGGWQSWTILRPGFFMTNLLSPIGSFMFPELASDKIFLTSFGSDTVLPLIAPDDIGSFAVSAFVDTKKFGSKEIDIAGEALTVAQIVESLSKAAGVPIAAEYRSQKDTAALAKMNPVVAAQVAARNLINLIDMEDTKVWGVRFHTFEEYLASAQDQVKITFGSSSVP
jgi:uncharacterized protein YbjT (DUF2867 family)